MRAKVLLFRLNARTKKMREVLVVVRAFRRKCRGGLSDEAPATPPPAESILKNIEPEKNNKNARSSSSLLRFSAMIWW